MNEKIPIVHLVRHCETAWSLTGQHTGLTDLPLTEHGRQDAARLRKRLQGLAVVKIFLSPLQRAVQTCEIAGLRPRAEINPDLVEWNYGSYEGRTSADIHTASPDWQLFRDGCPQGESPAQIAMRADRVVKRLREVQGDVLVFSSGHFLAVLATRWLNLEPTNGRFFPLSAGSLSALSYEHNLSQPVIRLWNNVDHLKE